MTSLFEHYDLLARSGLFDPEFYLANNPDVLALNVDPLLHYIESGASEGRDPHRDFDAAFYLEQCRRQGESPENPLLHYLMQGAESGLKIQRLDTSLDPTPAYPGKTASATSRPDQMQTGSHLPDPSSFDIRRDMRFYLEHPPTHSGSAAAPIRGNLSISGWAMAREGIAAIEIALDGRIIMEAHRGIQRRDVSQAFPDWPEAASSGFAISIPQRRLPEGSHLVGLQIRDNAGQIGVYEFRISVDKAVGESGLLPLRKRISQAEVDMQVQRLKDLEWRPSFIFAMAVPTDSKGVEAAKITLASLRDQAYPDWRLSLLTPDRKPRPRNLPSWCGDGTEETSRVSWAPQRKKALGADLGGVAKAKNDTYFTRISPGDVLGCDALLEFAAESGTYRAADFWYCDEQRLDPGNDTLGPYLKPQWSPDLLLSTNYIGRLWFARLDLLARTEATIDELDRYGEYDMVLRCAYAAREVRHLPAVLCWRGASTIDPPAMERQAIQRAIARHGESADVLPGCLPGIYRVRRQILSPARVSIIIPTCASRGLIRTCIETIRDRSTYRNFELICVDNIPLSDRTSKRWLVRHADKVVEMSAPFNWSRFNNLAVKEAAGDLLLFLNDDIEITQPDWLEGLIEHAQRPEIGVVGPQLLYPDGRVQHAGVFLVADARARHAFRYLAEDDPGPFGLALTQRNVIAVTGACLMTKRATFETAGGFDEAYDVVNNDLDYCLRLWQSGLRNIYTPYSQLVHHELASRADLGDSFDAVAFDRRWKHLFRLGDPYFHPGLSVEHDEYAVEAEPVQVVYARYPIFAKDAIRKILAVKLDHIGDCVTALPAIRRLMEVFPHAELHALAAPTTKAVLSSQSFVDDVIEFDFFHSRSEHGTREISQTALRALRERLAPHGFDLAVDFRKHPETRPVLLETGARYLAGFDYKDRFPWLDIALEWEGDVPGVRKRRHIGEDLSGLVDAISAACAGDRGILQAPWQPLPTSKPLICLHPGGGNLVKQWPPPYFAALIDLLVEGCGAQIVLVGDRADIPIGREILKQVEKPEAVDDRIARLPLAELPSLLGSCSLFVGNDSGPKHIAAGLGVPTVGIQSGVVDVREWGPVGPRAVAVRRDVTCSPCYIATAGECHRGLACLTGLQPREAYRLCLRILSPFLQSPSRPALL